MDFLGRLCRMYRYGFYDKHPNVLGANRLNDILRRAALLRVEKPLQEPVSIFEGEWRNLIIIDACRHDLYEEVHGDTSKRVTLGAHSREFIEKTFSSGDYSDYIYITANPHFDPKAFQKFTGRRLEDVFYEVYHTYKTDWDEDTGTVLPEPVIRDTRSAATLFPDKKLIIHFMQPHHPFLSYDYPDVEDNSIWNIAEKGIVERDEVWEAYKENLEFVMPYVKELAEELDGKTMLTSDHGNLVGENGMYHHPYGCNAKGLREVPWTEL